MGWILDTARWSHLLRTLGWCPGPYMPLSFHSFDVLGFFFCLLSLLRSSKELGDRFRFRNFHELARFMWCIIRCYAHRGAFLIPCLCLASERGRGLRVCSSNLTLKRTNSQSPSLLRRQTKIRDQEDSSISSTG